jgi:hypothetical protein
MATLIDTYNLIHAANSLGGAWTGLTVRGLCQWIIASPRREKTTLILDGRPKPDEPSENEFPELTFVYSGAGISADSVIAKTIERSSNRRNLTVVTNDRAVAEHARRNFAGAIGCEAFLNRLLDDHQKTASINRAKIPEKKSTGNQTPGEVEHWLKEFGIDAPVPPPKPKKKTAEEEIDDLDMDQLMGGSQ